MIVKVEVYRCLQCTICEEVVELREKTANHSEKLLMLIEEMAADHKDCEKFKDDPRRAKAERAYKVRMRDELAGLRNRKRRSR